jgi:hypothetical protein
MAPCTYVGLTLSVAPSRRIRFGSLEFNDIVGPVPTFNFYPVQALCFGDLDFVADHLGQLHLYEGDVPPLQTPSLDTTPLIGSPANIDPEAIASRINACLRSSPEPEQCRHAFTHWSTRSPRF